MENEITKYDVEIAKLNGRIDKLEEQRNSDYLARKLQDEKNELHFVLLNNENGRVKEAQNMSPSKEVVERDVNEIRTVRDRDMNEIRAMIKPLAEYQLAQQGMNTNKTESKSDTLKWIAIIIAAVAVAVSITRYLK